MRILVLGGTAWVGRTIAATAQEAGHDVTCLARGSAAFPAGVSLLRDDRASADAYQDATADLVVDVATDPQHVRTAVEALHGRVRRYAYVSSSSVYADHSLVGADETAATITADGPPPQDYGWRKAQCERAVAQAFPNHLVARSGLIGGSGDHTGRTTYWPWRFAQDRAAAVLVPAQRDQPMQVLDVRDLAGWLLTTDGVGTVDAVGPVTTLDEHLQVARTVAGHTGPLREAPAGWLADRGVEEWGGPRSLPLWLADRAWRGFAGRSGAQARAAGLRCRPLRQTLADGLTALGAGQPGSGLDDADHAALLAELAG